jgi:hypothetical protein
MSSDKTKAPLPAYTTRTKQIAARPARAAPSHIRDRLLDRQQSFRASSITPPFSVPSFDRRDHGIIVIIRRVVHTLVITSMPAADASLSRGHARVSDPRLVVWCELCKTAVFVLPTCLSLSGPTRPDAGIPKVPDENKQQRDGGVGDDRGGEEPVHPTSSLDILRMDEGMDPSAW